MAQTVRTEQSQDIFAPWLADRHWLVQDSNYDPNGDEFIATYALAYAFSSQAFMFAAYDYLGSAGYSQLQSASQDIRDAAQMIFEEIDGFVDIEFFKSASSNAPIQIAMDPRVSGAYAYLPADEKWGGDVFLGTFVVDPTPGNEAYLYIQHEIGHALGLEHGHEKPEFVASGYDSQEYTVLTYSDYAGDTDTYSFDSGPIDWAQSFMQLDIAALQFLYGANYSASGEIWSGDTVYGFAPDTGEMFINGVGQGAPAGNRIFRTIWDGHGNDTYDFSNYATDLVVDLAPGAFSLLSEAQLADLDRFSNDPGRIAAGNVANALLVDGDLRALIENANGGQGNDHITGNVAGNRLEGRQGQDMLSGLGGDDVLLGNGGDDLLTGGLGADSLKGGAGHDVLKGAQDEDILLGGLGDDLISGHSGDDTLKGGQNDDTLRGGIGDDFVSGNNGDDVLRGGGGNDTLVGGTGRDLLFGDDGADSFRFSDASHSPVGDKVDCVKDFVQGEDILDIRGLVLTPDQISFDGQADEGIVLVVTSENSKTRLLGDFDGDGQTDFEVTILGVTSLSVDDFLI